MRRGLLTVVLCVALVAPVAAQDPPEPLPPNLEALRVRLRQLQSDHDAESAGLT